MTDTADLSAVPKWGNTEQWSDERLAWAALADAVNTQSRYEEETRRLMDILTATPPPCTEEQQRQAVAAIVAGWDITA